MLDRNEQFLKGPRKITLLGVIPAEIRMGMPVIRLESDKLLEAVPRGGGIPCLGPVDSAVVKCFAVCPDDIFR